MRRVVLQLILPCLGVMTLPLGIERAMAEAFSPSQGEINTIVITARRLEESAQEVPVSVVNVTGRSLEQAGITTAQELQNVVSGLQVMVPNPRLAQFTLRGLGSSSFNEGLESSVGFFVDGVYLGRQSMSITDLIDIERIEVARGPQGTLFGKNATAGTIHVITQKPQFTPETLLEVSAGSFNTLNVRGTTTGPLSDTLAVRLTGWHNERDGLLENRRNGEFYNDRQREGLRGQLLWAPSSKLNTRVIVMNTCCTSAHRVIPLIVLAITMCGPARRSNSMRCRARRSGTSLCAIVWSVYRPTVTFSFNRSPTTTPHWI